MTSSHSSPFLSEPELEVDHQAAQQLEQVAKASQAKLQDVLRSALAAIASVTVFADGSWYYDYYSPGCVNVYGYTSEEFLADPSLWQSRVPAEDLPQVDYTQLSAAIFAEQTLSTEYRFHHKDGSLRWLSLILTSRRDEAVQGWIVTSVCSDITRQKHLEHSLQAANQVSQAASKAKSEFLATMSHEIRTPLNAVLGMSSLLLASPLSIEQRQWVETIHNGGEILLSVINDVLDFSQIEAGKLEIVTDPFPLADCLETVVNLLRSRAAEKLLHLRIHLDPDVPPRIRSDRHRLQQILINLVGNAIKFTGSGTITLSVESTLIDPDSLLTEIRFAVRDTGIGIPADRLNLIFEPFQQADGSITRQYGGTGLGLAICRRLCALLGGSINATSQVGVGSTFFFSIQAVQDRSIVASDPVAPAQLPSRGSSLRILVVEDNPVNQLVATAMLERLNHQTKLVNDGLEALAALEMQSYDLILMDLEMPNMDGLTATRRIRERYGSALPIIGLSAAAFAESSQAALKAGMNDYMTKPIQIKTLSQMLEQYLPTVSSTPTQVADNPLDPKVLANLQASLGSEVTVIPKMVVVYRQDSTQRLQNLRTAIGIRDTKTISQLAHGLKGSSAQMGAKKLGTLARELEQLGKSGSDLGIIQQTFSQIEQEWIRVDQALSRVI